MATDRMYLECRCGAPFRLARLDYDLWDTGSGQDMQARLDEWFAEHNHCDPDNFPAKPAFRIESDGPPSPQHAAYMVRVRTSGWPA